MGVEEALRGEATKQALKATIKDLSSFARRGGGGARQAGTSAQAQGISDTFGATTGSFGN